MRSFVYTYLAQDKSHVYDFDGCYKIASNIYPFQITYTYLAMNV